MKKDGTIIDCKIDAEDLQRVLDRGGWAAQWHKDFNSYLAIHYIPKEKQKESLHSFILGVDTKTPIKHLNADTLDNRKSNLEIYNKNSYNDYKEFDETAEIVLRDSNGIEKARAIIDKKDLYNVINNGYPWVYHKIGEKPYAVANTPKGRIHLDKFIMGDDQSITIHHINLNTLDNRKDNLEVVKSLQEQTE